MNRKPKGWYTSCCTKCGSTFFFRPFSEATTVWRMNYNVCNHCRKKPSRFIKPQIRNERVIDLHGNKLRLAPCTRADAEEMAAIELICFEDPFRFPYPRDQYATFVSNRTVGSLKITYRTIIIGYILWWHRNEIVTLNILPAWQHQGVATVLMTQFEHAIAETKTARLNVYTNNERALRLYQHLGYHTVATHHDYYATGYDAFEMHKDLML